MSWFGSLRLAYKIVFLLGISIFLIALAGAAKGFYHQRRRRRYARATNLRGARIEVAEEAHRRYQLNEGDLFGARLIESRFYGPVIQSRSGYVARAPPPSLLSSRTPSIGSGAPELAYLSLSGNAVSSHSIARLSSPLALNPITAADDLNRFQSPRKPPKPNQAKVGHTDIESIPASPTFSDKSIAGTPTSYSSPNPPKLRSHFSSEYPPTLHLSRDFRASFRSWSRSTRNIGHSASSSIATITRPVSCYPRPPSQLAPAIAIAEPLPQPLRVHRGERPFFGSSVYDPPTSRLPSNSACSPTLPTGNTTRIGCSRRTSASSSLYSTSSDLGVQLQSPDLSFFEQPPTPSIRLSRLTLPPQENALMPEARRISEAHDDPLSTSNNKNLAPPSFNTARQTSELGELYDSYWQHGLLNIRDAETSKRRAGDWGGFEPVVVAEPQEAERVGHPRRIMSGVAF